MKQSWTFGQILGAGLAAIILLTLVSGAVSVFALASVVRGTDRIVTEILPVWIDVATMNKAVETKSSAVRGYLLTGEEHFRTSAKEARDRFLMSVSQLEQRPWLEGDRSLLAAIASAEEAHDTAIREALSTLGTDAPADVARSFEERILPRRLALADAVDRLMVRERERIATEGAEAAATGRSATTVTGVLTALVTVLAILAGVLLTRSLRRQIGSSVGQVQSSSAELQAAANQQATGAREQASAMSEITTTMNELLATSKQIAESARRVASVAGDTAQASRSGTGTVDGAQKSIAAIRAQVDRIVEQMLDLGARSQQIGAVLEIVSELAEQTNILAINASIEAAGAGESGRRFAVVADEIRKLADRVSGSTKEIRELIELVRSAVNTTVMTTETGAKAVEAGAQDFEEVKSAFARIASLVVTTTEASREIELSTNQQATAVEQVNLAIAGVAQTTKETEASSSQTLQTASQLTSLSSELLRLIQPNATIARGAVSP